jgi:hypothetical protein
MYQRLFRAFYVAARFSPSVATSATRRRMSRATHPATARASRAARSEGLEGSRTVEGSNARLVVSGDNRPALGHATLGATACAARRAAAASDASSPRRD